MFDETPKHPCLTSGPGGDKCLSYGSGYSDEPCASCPHPGLYDDALNMHHFPTMVFLKNSSQPGKEERKVTKPKKYRKICYQCGDNKSADSHFDPMHTSKDGYKKICVKCTLENKEAVKEKEKRMAETTKDPRKTKIEDLTGPKSKEELEDKVDLIKYCAQEGISVAEVISSSKLPKITSARKNIALAMDADGIDRKIIAAELKVSKSTLWNYLHNKKAGRVEDEKPVDSPSVIELDFTGREDLLEEIRNLAKDRLRKPADQVLWWLINTDFDKLPKEA